jgi:hypothetical protein
VLLNTQGRINCEQPEAVEAPTLIAGWAHGHIEPVPNSTNRSARKRKEAVYLSGRFAYNTLHGPEREQNLTRRHRITDSIILCTLDDNLY